MGLLIEGVWRDQWYDTAETRGEFLREDAQFRNWITTDGTAGPSGEGGYTAEAGRYHLYISLACPWAHRALIFRQLKGLQPLIGLTVVDPLMLENGWELDEGARASSPVKGLEYLYQLYLHADADYSGRVTVPVVWDKLRQTIVSNESSEIIRMFNCAFNDLTGEQSDYYPAALKGSIDALNQRVYRDINNGVYRVGFATQQAAYEQAFGQLFSALDWLEGLLGEQRFLAGNQVTEADWRLFTTLIRFDSVYVGHFKANWRRIEDYPQLSNYLRDLYQWSGVAETVDFTQIKTHYYASHKQLNPVGIIPSGPELDYSRPHDRDRFA